jgi:hypothetical protein
MTYLSTSLLIAKPRPIYLPQTFQWTYLHIMYLFIYVLPITNLEPFYPLQTYNLPTYFLPTYVCIINPKPIYLPLYILIINP